MFFRAKFERFRMLFGAPTITAWRVEFNMASCCGSSNSSDKSGGESRYFSEVDIASEDESVGSDDSDRSSGEEISALWTRVYPPEPDDRVEDNFSVRNPGIQNMPACDSSPVTYFYLFLTGQILGKFCLRLENMQDSSSKQLEIPFHHRAELGAGTG